MGRLAEPPELLAAVEAVVPAGSRPWDGLRVLVTAGGTREPIDAVRYVGNRSSGRMGFAVAEEAAALGASVTVLAANVALPAPPARHLRRRRDRRAAARRRGRAPSPRADVLRHGRRRRRLPARAPRRQAQEGRPRRARAAPRADARHPRRARRAPPPGPDVVGFAAEHGDGALAYGRDKLARKGLDAIVVNDVSQPGIGFDAPTTR